MSNVFQSQDEQLLTPLHLACTYGQIEVAKILLESGAQIRSFGEKHQSSLHKAAAVGNRDIVRMLIYAAEQVYGQHEIEQVYFLYTKVYFLPQKFLQTPSPPQ